MNYEICCECYLCFKYKYNINPSRCYLSKLKLLTIEVLNVVINYHNLNENINEESKNESEQSYKYYTDDRLRGSTKFSDTRCVVW